MPLSMQEISDRLELQDLLVAYSHAIDFEKWDELDDVFTADAVIDYTAMGGIRGGLAEVKKFLADVKPMFPTWQHFVGTSKLTVVGDTATGRTMCHNPMVMVADDGSERVMFCGLWYRDTFVRTVDGWRIAERIEERGYFHNAPPGLAPPAGNGDERGGG